MHEQMMQRRPRVHQLRSVNGELAQTSNHAVAPHRRTGSNFTKPDFIQIAPCTEPIQTIPAPTSSPATSAAGHISPRRMEHQTRLTPIHHRGTYPRTHLHPNQRTRPRSTKAASGRVQMTVPNRTWITRAPFAAPAAPRRRHHQHPCHQSHQLHPSMKSQSTKSFDYKSR